MEEGVAEMVEEVMGVECVDDVDVVWAVVVVGVVVIVVGGLCDVEVEEVVLESCSTRLIYILATSRSNFTVDAR